MDSGYASPFGSPQQRPYSPRPSSSTISYMPSTHSNPFTLGGWQSYPQDPTPSVYGALPSPFESNVASGQPKDTKAAFKFTGFRPSIINCTVIGAQERVAFQVVTDANSPLYTLLKDSEGRGVALIEWQAQPFVEIRGLFSKQRAKDWLRLNSSKTARTMEFRGSRYQWAPVDQFLCLYTSSSSPKMLARVSKGSSSVTIELTQDALQLGLLEVSLVATILLQSGRPID